VPLVYVLLLNKQKRTYQKMLDIVKEQCLTMGLNPSPAVIMLDFEVSAMDAFRKVWPTASIRCCRFHMGQAMYRKVCDLGLASAYKDDAETGKWLKHFFRLSLLSPDEVGDAFAVMADAPQNSSCEAFADYMLNTYVAPDSRFRLTLWASAPTAEELPRTNNGCESFHSHLSKSFSGPHPNIGLYHFSNALLLYQTNTYIQLQNIRSQKLVKKQEGIRREFIKRTWASYTTGQISRKDYICKMCYKFLPVF